MLRVIEAIAHDELVGALEAHIAAVHVGLIGRVLAQERGHGDGRRPAGLQVLDEIAEREARVQNILGNDHVATLDVGVQILQDAHHPRVLHAAAVGRHRHEVHFQRHVDGADEIAGVHGRSAQHAYHDDALGPGQFPIITRDRGAEVGNPLGNVLLGEQDL